MIKIIAAVGAKLELGKKGGLIWHLPNDLKFFKGQTDGCPIVMGRNTFNSLPKKLPNRKHYVLTDKMSFNKDVDGVVIFYDFDSLLEEVKQMAKTQDVFIVGGASVYKQFLEYADELILTEVKEEDWTADAYFPGFDKNKYDKVYIASGEDKDIKYDHVRYVRKQ